jgi:glycosyltransferase involved in cell wall biosynthesis
LKIGVYLEGDSWGDIGPETISRGLGGRETAAVRLSECWADLGHEVHLFVPRETSATYARENGGSTTYMTTDMALPMLTSFEYDAVLSWESPEIFLVPGVRENVKAALCGMQVAHFMTNDPEAILAPDCWVALSEWHAKFMATQASGNMRNISVMPNCVNIDLFDVRTPESMLNAPIQFLYASSPDRGLVHLLRSWDVIRREFPEAYLHVAYGIENFVGHARFAHGEVGEMALDIEGMIDQEGIIYHGRIGQQDLAKLHSKCDALLYPCDPMSPTETGCITVIEAAAAGNIPIITDADCLKSEFSDVAVVVSLPWDVEKYVRAARSTLNDRDLVADLRRRGRKFAESRSWDLVAKDWIELFNETAESARHSVKL